MISFQLPAGPMNLQALFPAVIFAQVEEYFLELKTGGVVLATTNRYERNDCCCDDTIRLFFVNYLGGIDAINLKYVRVETDVKSTQWKKPLVWPLEKWTGGLQRSNVTAVVMVTAQTDAFEEEDQAWLDEVRASPGAWIQWTGTQGQCDDYLPVVIVDAKYETRKNEERYYYPFIIQFVMANDKIILRN